MGGGGQQVEQRQVVGKRERGGRGVAGSRVKGGWEIQEVEDS